jgi:hypothetical protein
MKIHLVGAHLFRVDGRTDKQTDGQIDSYEEAGSHLSQVCERAYKWPFSSH